jgi:hypothetical protein
MGVRNVASLSALSSLAAATIRLRLQLCRAGCVVLTTKIMNPEQSTRSRFLSLIALRMQATSLATCPESNGCMRIHYGLRFGATK